MSIAPLIWTFVALVPAADRAVIQRLTNGTVWVIAGKEGRGSGWIVDRERRHIVTNYHVVGDAKEVDLVFPAYQDGNLVANRAHYERDFNSLRCRGRVLRRDPQRDLALIEAEGIPKTAIALKLARAVAPGEPVVLCGNRRDLDTLWNIANGSIRQVFRNVEGIPWRTERLAKNCSVLALDAPIAEGDSGGPVVNKRGEIVGVVSAVLFPAQRMTTAIALPELRTFLKQPPEDVPADPKLSSFYERVMRSVVWAQSPTSTQRASGIVIDADRRLVLTSANAAGTRDRVSVIFPKWQGGSLVADLAAYEQEKRVPAVVMARDPRRNLALLQLGSIPKSAKAMALAEKSASTGDALHAVGNPNGIDALWLYSAAHVRQIGTAQFSPKKDDPSAGVLILQAPPAGNDSGGPIVNSEGKLAAMASAKDGPEPQISYAIDLHEIRGFLNDHRWAREPRDAASRVRRAKHFLRVHWWAEAETELRLATRAEPGNVEAWQYLAETVLATGNSKDALTIASQALDAAPEQAKRQLRCTMARANLARSDLKSAKDEIRVALETDAKCADALVLRATVHRLEKRLDVAAKDADEAIWLDANLAGAYFERAQIRSTQRNLDKALEDINRAIELDPYNPAFLDLRAAVHLARDDKAKAESDKKAATNLRTENNAR